jgi:hypothetical protein
MQRSKATGRRGLPGSLLVVAILGLAACLAAFAVWFQWTQTRRCLAFFGPEIATAIQVAPRVEAWRLSPTGGDGRPQATSRTDVSQARGLVHLRHGLVEDSNYAWTPEPSAGRPPAAWDVALAFFSAGAAAPTAVLAFDLEHAGAVTVVGRPGRISLGRLAPGLRKWMAATLAAPAPAP